MSARSISKKTKTFKSAELAERSIHRRAVEAVIWGMPAVNYDLMLQEMLSKTAGKVGQVIYWGRPLDSKNQTLTPNPDALYFMTFFNTKDGPVVLDLPPGDANGSFNGNIVTVWQMPLEDAGLLGIDKGKGGKFVALPPGYKDKGSSQIPEMQKNADGSIDVYFGPKAPAGKESNWVPTKKGGGFEAMFRLYAPKREFFDKIWELPDVERMN